MFSTLPAYEMPPAPAAMDVRQDFTRWTTRVELLPLVAVMVYSPAGSMSAYLPVEEAEVAVYDLPVSRHSAVTVAPPTRLLPFLMTPLTMVRSGAPFDGG